MTAPCKDCPDRHVLCWNDCEKYRQSVEKQRAIEKAVKQGRKENGEYRAVRFNNRKWRKV